MEYSIWQTHVVHCSNSAGWLSGKILDLMPIGPHAGEGVVRLDRRTLDIKAGECTNKGLAVSTSQSTVCS